MLSAIITAAIALLTEISPLLAAGSTIAKIISLLETIVPVLVQTASELVPTVKNLIAMMKSKDGITPDQLDTLDKLEAQIDADWQKASDAADAEDGAAKPAP